MRVLISGATGLIGTALSESLQRDNHSVVSLTRRTGLPDSIYWDPDRGELGLPAMEEFDAVVHLAAENIGGRRWNAQQKARILNSRTDGTQLLAQTLAHLSSPPQTLISVSGIGYYGNRGDELLAETSAPGDDFLARVCVEWEQATEPAVKRGLRVVIPRLGIVLATHGGALQRMLLPFKLGGGGPFGSGRQWWSWVLLEDVIGAMRFCLEDARLQGPVNVVAPNPVTNAEFARTLARVLHRPAILPLPGFVLKAAIGEMAEPLLLYSQRVVSKKLQDAGYRFAVDDLEPALTSLLRKGRKLPLSD